MATTNFVAGTTIASTWLNDVDGSTYQGQLDDGTTNASIDKYTPAGTGAISTTVQAKLRESVSVLDFYANGVSGVAVDPTGVVDSTLGIQAAITYAVSVGKVVLMPAGTYLVTGTITCPVKTMVHGEHWSQSAIDNGTRINFQPTTALSLFDAGVTGAFKDGYSFQNLYIVGNSANAAGNSVRAFNLIKVIKSTFRNMRVDGFRTAFRLEATINNRFEFIQMANHYLYDIYYTGDTATSDVWDQCYISNAPIGVQTDGVNLAIRFINCIFESLETYGIDLVKECYGWQVINGYGEDTPSANVAANCVFRVGFAGTTLASSPQLQVTGGTYVGRQAGAVGSVLSVDYTDGVVFGGGLTASGFTSVIKTSSNTQTNQIVSTGFTCASISSVVTDATKISGFYPLGAFNSSARNQQTSNLVGTQVTGADTACTGAITTVAAWKLTKDGAVVTLVLPSVTGTATAATNFKFGEVIPAAYRPSASLAWPCVIRDNGAASATSGMIILSYSTGEIIVYKDGTGASNFTNAADAGLGQGCGTSVSWMV